ncbi:Rieske 2Fe-2S domain-containing protein [Streptomyces sp. NPDC015232]|uniref:Rieske 2Fe-2S domain-containing protein n=1 Tax=unclassified Streptomyces TaxID=2593676 RepID=UPI0036FA0875
MTSFQGLPRPGPPPDGGPGPALRAMDRLAASSRADGVIDAVRDAVRRVPLGAARDVLHGRPLGHPAHPLLVQLPLGAWLSAALLDLTPGGRRPARLLVGAGLAAAGPAAVSGWVDWAELRRPQQRVGLVHAAANITGVLCYAVSLRHRCLGRHVRGRLWGFGGLAAVGAGGAIGGHLAYRMAAGPDHAEPVAVLVPPGWHRVEGLPEPLDPPEGRPAPARVGGMPVVVVRTGADDTAPAVLAGRCAHQDGPLADGEVVDGCLVCPWHGSHFRLDDGWNVTGPATAPQPSFDTRLVDGHLEARLRTP